MLPLQLYARTLGNPGSGPPGAEGACAVQGGPGCAAWGSGGVWGDGSVWCSNVGVPYEFIAQHETRGHRISVIVRFTYCPTPGLPEAFRIFQLRALWANERQAQYPYHADIDAVTQSEQIQAIVRYTSVPGIADQTTNARHGSVVGSPGFGVTPATGYGHSIQFGPTTSDAYLTLPDAAVFNQTPMSVEFWAKLEDTSSNEWNTPIVKSTSNQWDDGWGFYDRHSTGTVTFWVNAYDAGASPNKIYAQAPRPTRGTAHHYVGTYDGTTVKLYIDGVLVNESTASVTPQPTAVPIKIGYGGFSQSGWEGTIDEVAFYDSVLTDYQVLRHYETQRSEYREVFLQDAPASYWTLDEEGPYGSDFKIYELQLRAQVKKHQPKG